MKVGGGHSLPPSKQPLIQNNLQIYRKLKCTGTVYTSPVQTSIFLHPVCFNMLWGFQQTSKICTKLEPLQKLTYFVYRIDIKFNTLAYTKSSELLDMVTKRNLHITVSMYKVTRLRKLTRTVFVN